MIDNPFWKGEIRRKRQARLKSSSVNSTGFFVLRIILLGQMLCPLGPYRQQPQFWAAALASAKEEVIFFSQIHFPLFWRITYLQPNSSIYPFPACKIPRVWQLCFIFVQTLCLLVVVSINDLTVICSKMLSSHAPGSPSRACGAIFFLQYHRVRIFQIFKFQFLFS